MELYILNMTSYNILNSIKKGFETIKKWSLNIVSTYSDFLIDMGNTIAYILIYGILINYVVSQFYGINFSFGNIVGFGLIMWFVRYELTAIIKDMR